jgi:two-component system NtrC family sensor kinase
VITLLKDDLPCIIGNHSEIQQVFLNIINNAIHAMKSSEGEKKLIVKSGLKDNFIRTSFEDTGEGIPAQNLQKIFEPLFTTKKAGEGTGLGLSICYDIVREHEGKMFVASESDKGTCFVVEFPAQAENRAS